MFLSHLSGSKNPSQIEHMENRFFQAEPRDRVGWMGETMQFVLSQLPTPIEGWARTQFPTLVDRCGPTSSRPFGRLERDLSARRILLSAIARASISYEQHSHACPPPAPSCWRISRGLSRFTGFPGRSVGPDPRADRDRISRSAPVHRRRRHREGTPAACSPPIAGLPSAFANADRDIAREHVECVETHAKLTTHAN